MTDEEAQAELNINPSGIRPMGLDSRKLIKVLRDVAVGDVLAYSDMTIALGGRDVQGEARCYLQTARRYMEREENVTFLVIRNVGLQRATDAEAIGQAADGIHKIRRAASRSMQTAACADYGRLSEPEKTKHNVVFSLLGALRHATTSRRMRKLEEKVQAVKQRLAAGDVLGLLRGDKKDETTPDKTA